MKYPNASGGLKLMCTGEILTIIGAVLTIILIGPIISLIGSIVALVGLYRARQDDEGYGTAFTLSIVNIVLGLVGMFFPEGFGASLISIISSIIALAIMYYVCTTTSNLLHSVGEETIAARGQTVWNINIVCTIVSVVLSILAYVPLLNVLAAFGAVVVVIVELVGYILYLMFLYGSYNAL